MIIPVSTLKNIMTNITNKKVLNLLDLFAGLFTGPLGVAGVVSTWFDEGRDG